MKKFFLPLCFSFFSLAIAAQELEPTDAEGLAKFTILDKNGIPEEGAVVRAETVDKKFSKKATTDINGKCAMLIPEGLPFKVSVNKFGVTFDFGIQNLSIKPGPNIANYKLTIELVTTYKRIYTLNQLYFEPGKSDITGLKIESIDALNQLYDTLKADPKMKIEIAGHTDNVGEDVTNMNLSQKRANSIMDYLVKKGIDPSRMLAKGYGETAPVASNDYPEGRMLNRRTEIRIIEE